MSFINNRENKKSNCVPSLQNHPYLDRSTLLQFIYNDRRTDQINRLVNFTSSISWSRELYDDNQSDHGLQNVTSSDRFRFKNFSAQLLEEVVAVHPVFSPSHPFQGVSSPRDRLGADVR